MDLLSGQSDRELRGKYWVKNADAARVTGFQG
jgi:hypothetical protein